MKLRIVLVNGKEFEYDLKIFTFTVTDIISVQEKDARHIDNIMPYTGYPLNNVLFYHVYEPQEGEV